MKTLTTPEIVENRDKVDLGKIVVDIERQKIKICLCYGHDDNGTLVVTRKQMDMLTGTDYTDIMDVLCDNTLTIQEQIEEAVWDKLIALGKVDVQ